MRHAPSQPQPQADVAFCGDGSQDAAYPRCLALNHSMEHSPKPHNGPDYANLALSLLVPNIPSIHPMTTDHLPRCCQGPQPACPQRRHTQPRSEMHHGRAGDVGKQTTASRVSISMPSPSSRVHNQVMALWAIVHVHRHLHMYLPTLRP